ncbi:MAG: Prephenate dehydrogenase [Alphaproteobacteria bacterium MarineAlpha4_Bin2]|nr:MAG: Prephenate dehydrogenase [Alphaproteobacteria bacterium MarineAlpha4_Bin2]
MSANEPLFERMALIGLGLLGSSLARVVKREGLARHIAGSTRSRATLERAHELGFLDSIHEKPLDVVEDADLVVLCAPVGTYGEIAAVMAPALRPGAIVTDVGSVKQAVVRDVAPHMPEGVFLVPGHPVAGTEQSGPDAGFAELFEDRYCILTPPHGTDEGAVEKIAEFWRRAGSMVEIMDPHHHDRVLAITSHLPHLIAYTIVGTASDLESQLIREVAEDSEIVRTREVIRYSAGGFRDFTRIAASPPEMWRDIFLNNRDTVLEMLGRFTEDLTALQRAIRWGEGDKLYDWFERTREIRQGVVDMRQAGSFNPAEQKDDPGSE